MVILYFVVFLLGGDGFGGVGGWVMVGWALCDGDNWVAMDLVVQYGDGNGWVVMEGDVIDADVVEGWVAKNLNIDVHEQLKHKKLYLHDPKPPLANSVISAPAGKVFPLPVRTMAATPRSALARFKPSEMPERVLILVTFKVHIFCFNF